MRRFLPLLRTRKRLIAGAGGAAALLAFSAHATLVSIEQSQRAAGRTPAAASPSVPLTPPAAPAATVEQAAPQAGTTGTTQLPAIPVPQVVSLAPGDDSIRPARPFRLSGRATDDARALQCLTTAIYYEAASEPDDGQRAVAQVVLNRVRHPAFPATVCGVVYQGSEKRGCQFSFACDGALARVPMRSAWARAQRAAARALAGDVFAPVGLATHYHTYAVTPSWNRSLVMTGVYGAHFFHRWKGWWGTPAAFTDRYAGGEPLPGPHLPIAPPAALASAAPLATATPPAPPQLVEVQPRHVDSGQAVAAATQDALPQSQVLDRWKDSGQPLR